MKKLLPLLSILLVSGTAIADDAALQKCRALGEASARLRCYDAIPLTAGNPVASAAPAAAPVAANAAPTAATTAEQNFGIEQVKKKTEDEPKSIESTIVGTFDGWGPNSRIKLANGQVWRIVDGSDAVLTPMQNPKARIERNVFGTMFLHVEGTNNSAKVRRVQ
ncbi:hypothetical protein GCM10027321_03410 [Massilia terrae]|uniref:Secreted protein n=1 Tax=Massilia terrae TaxID=1811224 RepID=A0ABT2CU33_9BURK|nr:hypothetical protein [Massilia terrae]MCS0657295.1 hypothetical protein [Massilia terrae]